MDDPPLVLMDDRHLSRWTTNRLLEAYDLEQVLRFVGFLFLVVYWAWRGWELVGSGDQSCCNTLPAGSHGVMGCDRWEGQCPSLIYQNGSLDRSVISKYGILRTKFKF